jgi:hypothetical protein
MLFKDKERTKQMGTFLINGTQVTPESRQNNTLYEEVLTFDITTNKYGLPIGTFSLHQCGCNMTGKDGLYNSNEIHFSYFLSGEKGYVGSKILMVDDKRKGDEGVWFYVIPAWR